jgi:hypothetical protein
MAETFVPKTPAELDTLRISNPVAYAKYLTEQTAASAVPTKPIAETLRDNAQAGLVGRGVYDQLAKNTDYAKNRENFIYAKGAWRPKAGMSDEDKAAYEAGMDPVEYRSNTFEARRDARDAERSTQRAADRAASGETGPDINSSDIVERQAAQKELITARLRAGSPGIDKARAAVQAEDSARSEVQRLKSTNEREDILSKATGSPVKITMDAPAGTVGQVSTDGGKTFTSIAEELAANDKATGYVSVEETLRTGKQMPENQAAIDEADAWRDYKASGDTPEDKIRNEGRMRTERGRGAPLTSNPETGEAFTNTGQVKDAMAQARVAARTPESADPVTPKAIQDRPTAANNSVADRLKTSSTNAAASITPRPSAAAAPARTTTTQSKAVVEPDRGTDIATKIVEGAKKKPLEIRRPGSKRR